MNKLVLDSDYGIWVVIAVDGCSAPKVTCFNSKEAAIEYTNNMAADTNDKIDGRVLILNI
jgi:hypothetical protein